MKGFTGRLVGWLGLMVSLTGWAQVKLAPAAGAASVIILPTDTAVLEDAATRKDLVCVVAPSRPELGLDLRFHAGYTIRVLLKDLAGDGDLLRTLARVTPLDRPGSPVYLTDRFPVPAIAEGARGEATLDGRFSLGEGRYRVDWLMRDRAERVCSGHWEAVAERASGERQLALLAKAGTVAAEPRDPFYEEPPVQRAEGASPLRVRILLNLAPQRPDAFTMPPEEVRALLGLLREIAREPRIGQFSLTAFNARQQRVLHRQPEAARIDFPGLGASLDALNLAAIDYRQIQDKNPETAFFASLIEQEFREAPDAVIFVGPKLMLADASPEDWHLPAGLPAFYMNYSPNPAANPWSDSIGAVVKRLRGRVYSISSPAELAAAWRDLIGRLAALTSRHQGS